MLPNTQSVPAQAVVSVQEVQQIPKWRYLGVGLQRREQSSTKPHTLPALGHWLKNPMCSGSPSMTDCSELADFFSLVNYIFV